MSLYSAVFHTEQVPYRDVDYYGAITQPTPRLESFMARVMRRLGTTQPAPALFHLDQGMGGGELHALVGSLPHGRAPRGVPRNELGQRVRREAEDLANGTVDPSGARTLVLSADHMTPGASSSEYGPARTLFEPGFRDYISARVERNGTKLAVTEPQNFRSILRRRIFEPASQPRSP